MANKVPRFLKTTGFTVSGRPELPIDSLDGEGTAKDSARPRVPHKVRIWKRTKRKLMLMEEWVDFVKEKRRL